MYVPWSKPGVWGMVISIIGNWESVYLPFEFPINGGMTIPNKTLLFRIQFVDLARKTKRTQNYNAVPPQ